MPTDILRQSPITTYMGRLSPTGRGSFSTLEVGYNSDLYNSHFANLPALGHPKATGQSLPCSNKYECLTAGARARRFPGTVTRATRLQTPTVVSEPVPIRLSNMQLRLATELMSDFYRKQPYLEGAVISEVLTSAISFLLIAQMLTPNEAVLSLTYDPSLVLRVDLGAGRGQVNMSLTLGSDSDPSDNTFLSLYKNGYEEWSWSGPFADMLQQGLKLRARLEQSVPNNAATAQQLA